MRYTVTLYVPGMPFRGDTLSYASLGGSETAALCMARELRKLGHNVTVFSNCDEGGEFDGVIYQPAQLWQQFMTTTPQDICIVQRHPQAFASRLNSKLNLLWAHDLALGRMADEARGVMWNIDRVMVVSEFMKENYHKVYGLPKDTIWATRNGVDLDLFPAQGERDRKRLVYSARPERGLDVLLERVMPELLKRDPELKLHIYGYDNPVSHMQSFYDRLKALGDSYGGAVVQGGCLTKEQLYGEYTKAGVYVYPTPSPTAPGFNEVSCITAMECQAAGLPIVASDRGALSETIHPDAGMLVDGVSWSDEYVGRFCDQVMALVNDDAVWAKCHEAGLKNAKNLSWSSVAEEWTEGFDRLIAGYNDDPVRLAHHFYRRSDIFAAKKALDGQTSPAAVDLKNRIAREFAFAESEDALREHYETFGKETEDRIAAGDPGPGPFVNSDEKRFHELERFLNGNPGLGRVLDYGCGHGWSPIYLHNKTGREFVGCDLDPGAVRTAQRLADKYANDPAKVSFCAPDDVSGQFDAVICSEVLEHAIDPFALIERAESFVKPGGIVIVTVPHGPAEYGTDNWDRFKNHLWEFDLHDLRDMFGAKKGLSLHAQPIHANDKTGETVGYFFAYYVADHEPVGRIDWDRKLKLQRPRETVSASLMCGPNAEHTLAWCLDSLRWVVDEIVIADTGLNDIGRMIAERYGARIIPSVSPLEYGFETPRNHALDECRMDFVLWIDADERLLDPQNVTKYLRQSCWNGFSIKQHHFAVDADFNPDMPVRLFRRAPYEGQTIRHYGMIHEHPELELNKGPGPVIVLPDVNIAHVGYLNENGRRKRFGRNLPLLARDQEKYPERLLQKHFIMRDLALLNSYDLQQNGGELTDMIRARADQIIALYREHFLGGKCNYLSVDPAEYYTQALQIKGIGFDISVDIRANRDGKGQQLNGGPRMRVANEEEALAEITARAKRAIDPIKSEYW